MKIIRQSTPEESFPCRKTLFAATEIYPDLRPTLDRARTQIN